MNPSLQDFPSDGLSELLSETPIPLLHEIPSPSAPDRVDFVPELAWRNWYATPDGELVSPQQEDAWPARERFEAVCYKSNPVYSADPAHLEPAPEVHCVCGIYGHRDRRLPLLHFALASADVEAYVPEGLEPAVGQVSLWGRMVEHEHGWRAEYAYPYFVRVLTKGRAKLIRDRYGVDTEVQP